MQKFLLTDYQKYKNYHDNFLHSVFNIINNELNIKKLYIYHNLFYII